MIISREKYNKLPKEYKRHFEEFKNRHPTVKSLGIMEYLIKLVSKEGSTILDPFLGSGTTAIACIKTNRKYIGIEKESDYIKIAEARINAWKEKTEEKITNDRSQTTLL